jgi:general secretion pathway protein A
MFTTHFKMTTQPFLENITAKHILQDERISEGLARLQYLAAHGTLALVTGTTGVGKSSLIKLLFSSLSGNRFQPAYVYLTHVGGNGLLKLIVSALGESPRHSKERLFLQILEKAQQNDSVTLLVLDEAQLIGPPSLTDLRLLVSSLADQCPSLKMILCGQETLRDQLKRSCHAPLVHRISVRYHIPPMSSPQTDAYIDHHMTAAGASSKIFEPEAKALIHDYAGGLPRQVNNIATACLINAAGANLPKIDQKLVNQTIAEFQLP